MKRRNGSLIPTAQSAPQREQGTDRSKPSSAVKAQDELIDERFQNRAGLYSAVFRQGDMVVYLFTNWRDSTTVSSVPVGVCERMKLAAKDGPAVPADLDIRSEPRSIKP